MEDNKINGLELPLEYLDLPDDEAPLAQEDQGGLSFRAPGEILHDGHARFFR